MINLALSWQEAAVAAAGLLAGAAAGRLAGRPRLARVATVARETGLLLGLFALWQFAGGLAARSPGPALARAQWIWHAERVLRLPSEAAVQRAFLPHPLLIQLCNLYYASLHFVVLVGCLGWLFIRHRGHYPRVRTTVVVYTGCCLLIQFIGVAPPRLLPGDGLVDTALRYGQSVYSAAAGISPDQLSAMPSVHVGWALLVALTVIGVLRSRWRWLALAYPALTTLVVVVTANHFWLDGAVAVLLLAAVLSGQRALRALGIHIRPRPRESWEQREQGSSHDPTSPPVLLPRDL
jgi:hypothetical protein